MIKRFICYIKQCNRLLADLSKNEKIPMVFLWIDSLWALFRHGCLIKQYTHGEFYKIARPFMGRAISQRRLEKIIRNSNQSSHVHILKNKNEFNVYFKEWIQRQWLWSKTMDETLFESMISQHRRLFIKPLDDQEGHGIRVIENVDKASISKVFCELKNENVLIEESIIQHPMMNFGNTSVNTVRIITCLDTKGNTHILRAALRVGIGKAVVDNFSAGGALYDIDVDSGRIDNKGIGHDGRKYIYHPGTDICMLGYQIPNWDILVKGVVKASKLIPQCRFIGWDVAITDDGIELIEGNHNPGLFTIESVGKPCAYKEALGYLNI